MSALDTGVILAAVLAVAAYATAIVILATDDVLEKSAALARMVAGVAKGEP